MDSVSRLARISAVAGAAVWIGTLVVRTGTDDAELIEKIFLLGVLVIVPLGLWLVATPSRTGVHSLPYHFAVIAQPVGAVSCLASFLFGRGLLAALLASIWLLVTMSIALFGLWRLLQRGVRPAEEFCIDAGLVYVAVGGVWFTMSRLGYQPLGFGDTIVLLTAVHFHFAGFAAPILSGMAGRKIGASGPRMLFRMAAVGVVCGTPLVAAGITFWPALALLGALIISLGLVLLAVLVVGWILRRIGSLTPKILLTVSSVSSSTAMLLACVYAYSIVAKKLIIDIPQMAITHGILNSFGFAVCGLLAWSIVQAKSRVSPPGVPFSTLPTRCFVGPDYFERVDAISTSKSPLGLVDQFSIYGRADFDPNSINPTVKSFYEETYRYRLVVRPHWKSGFRLGGKVAHLLGTWVGQLRLPIAAEGPQDYVQSRLLNVDDSIDGRTGVRGWVRTYEGTDNAMYVAAYSTHSMLGNTYMNIAFPLPGGNLSSILHIEPMSSSGNNRGVVLTTLAEARAGGDQGVYYANRFLPVRLPLNETITVWPPDSEDFGPQGQGEMKATLKAKHEMWLFGINFLNLDYDIFPAQKEKMDTLESSASD